jgi:O-antigen/teichoic acid export membrane protein
MTENIHEQDIAFTEAADDSDGRSSMRQDIFGLGRKSLAYVIGHLATRAVSFLLLPLYTNVLAPEDMGILSLAFAFSAFGLIIFHMGLDSALLRYYVGESPEKQRQVVTTVYITLILVGLILSGIILSIRSPLAGSLLGTPRPEWIAILTGIIFLDTLWIIPMHLYRADEKPLPYITFSLINVTITMVLNILLVVHYGLGVAGALVANLIASGTLFLLTMSGIVRHVSLAAFSPRLLKILLRFGLPLLLAGLFTMTIELAGRYLLRWLTTLETVGLYSAGYKLGVLMLILVMGFNMGWQPFFLRRGKEPGAQPIFARITTYMVAVMGAILLAIGAWVDDLVRLPLGSITLFGSEYWSATRIVPVVMLGYLLFGLYVLQLPGIHLSTRTKWVMLFRGSGAFINVISNLALIPVWGAMGAALSTCISFAVMALITFLVTRRFYPVPYEWGRLARIFGLIALGIAGLYIFPSNVWRNLVLTALIPAGVWLTGVLTPEERRTLGRFLRQS